MNNEFMKRRDMAVKILEKFLATPIIKEIRMSAELRHKNSFPMFGLLAVYKISNIEYIAENK